MDSGLKSQVGGGARYLEESTVGRISVTVAAVALPAVPS